MDDEFCSAELRECADEFGIETTPRFEVSSWEDTAATWLESLDSLSENFESGVDREHRESIPVQAPNEAFLNRTQICEQESGQLAGVDVAVKDNIAVADVPLTCGSPELESYSPTADASVVQRILNTGGRIVGKTAMSEFALGGNQETMRIQVPTNPHDSTRYPGGSSTGSAVAVAENSADVALGTDTAASIRCPAAYCGVVGLRPTSSLVSHHGVVGFAPTFDSVGTLSSTVAQSAMLLEVIAGEDTADPRTHGTQTREYQAAIREGTSNSPADIKIGVPEFATADADVTSTFRETMEAFSQAGATVKRISIPDIEYAFPAWLGIATAEFRSLFRSPGTGMPRRPIELATNEISSVSEDLREFLVCSEALHRDAEIPYESLARDAQKVVRRAVESMLEEFDALATPTMPTVAPRWDEKNADADELDAVTNTVPFSVADTPAISIPVNRDNGLPVGIQLVGSRFGEKRLLEVAASFERYLGQ